MSETAHDTIDVVREPPTPRSFSRPYWDGTRQKKLLVQFDRRNGKYQFFRAPPACSTAIATSNGARSPAKAKCSPTRLRGAAQPGFRGKEPYLIATVTLDVGVNVIANIVHCGLEEIAIGLKVKPYWLPLANGTHLLMFEPAR